MTSETLIFRKRVFLLATFVSRINESPYWLSEDAYSVVKNNVVVGELQFRTGGLAVCSKFLLWHVIRS